MAELVGLPVEEVSTYESGADYAPTEVVERYAVALGMSTLELLRGEEPSAVAVLFRRIRHEGDTSALETPETHRVLGDFARCARQYVRLRQLIGAEPPRYPWLTALVPEPLTPRPELYEQARRLATMTRAYLELDPVAPIPSMRRLVEDLGIVTLFVEPEQLDPHIKGASLLNPHPAILVNLVGGGEKWWHTRMTIAHELCHILFDRTTLNPQNPRKFFVFSPYAEETASEGSARRSWRLFDHFEDLEARANAFAGDFLAPTSGVAYLVGTGDPTTMDAINRVCDHYQLGHETAINRLQNTFRLSTAQRKQMLSRLRMYRAGPPRHLQLTHHDDSVPPGAQLRDRLFTSAVLDALRLGKIDGVEARAHLDLRLSEPLPETAPDAGVRGPLLSETAIATRAAERHLYRVADLDHYVDEIQQIDGAWYVSVARRSAGEALGVARFRMGLDLALLEPLHLPG
jgi:hypothetical protein